MKKNKKRVISRPLKLNGFIWSLNMLKMETYIKKFSNKSSKENIFLKVNFGILHGKFAWHSSIYIHMTLSTGMSNV